MDSATTNAFIISAAALFSTIIGPIITAAITCSHESRMYKNRFYTEHEHEAIERYLRTVGRFIFGNDYPDQKDLGEATSEIFMYAPKYLWKDIRKINTDIIHMLNSNDYHSRPQRVAQLRFSYLALCESFSELRRSKKKKKKIKMRRVRKLRNTPKDTDGLVAVYHAAHTDDGAEDKIIYRTKEEIAAMENAPESDIDI